MQRFVPLAVLAGFLLPAGASAQMQTYYHAGAWDVFSGRDDGQTPVCGLGTVLPNSDRRLAIRFAIGGNDASFTATKPDWSIPDNTRIGVIMQVGLNTPLTAQAMGSGHDIVWRLERGPMQAFEGQFRGAPSMTLTFPQGNEPPWALSLAGSAAASATFDRCVRDLSSRVQGAPPAPGPAGGPPAATQPFGAPQDR